MTASRVLFECDGGQLVLPDPRLVLVDRLDGGNLIVNPPREVWERSELTAGELTSWSFLVAAAGRAMIDALPQLDGGCVNYWEAGNWALNDLAEPLGLKTARERRRVHLHLLGRSRSATHPAFRWGEAPKFPDFVERFEWAAPFERLTAEECGHIVREVEKRLLGAYAFDEKQIVPWTLCPDCNYPTPDATLAGAVCLDCGGR